MESLAVGQALRDLVQAATEGANGRLAFTRVQRLSDALACFAAQRFDAVLLDLLPPDSDGLEAVERVRAAAPHPPIVVLTGASGTEGVDALQAGAEDYLDCNARRWTSSAW